MIDLNELCKISLATAEQRQRNGGNIKTDTRSMLKHCATEVVEATEAYSKIRYFPQLNLNEQEIVKEQFSSELADIICCVLIIAGKEGIDMEKALTSCIEKNRKRAEGIGDKL